MAKSNGMRMNENCRASRRKASIRLVATPASSSGAGSLTASRNASRMAGSISCPCGDGVGLGFRGSGIPALPPSQTECDRENSLCSEMPDIAGISCSLLLMSSVSFALLCYAVPDSVRLLAQFTFDTTGATGLRATATTSVSAGAGTFPAGAAAIAAPIFDATGIAAFHLCAAIRLIVDRYLDGNAAFQHDLNRIFRHVDRDNLAGATRRGEHGADMRHGLLGLNVIFVFI